MNTFYTLWCCLCGIVQLLLVLPLRAIGNACDEACLWLHDKADKNTAFLEQFNKHD